MDASFDQAAEDLWVFGYGSLIWRPGFDYLDRAPANIIGMHRSLCIYSFDHRGTPESPGLVLGRLVETGIHHGLFHTKRSRIRHGVSANCWQTKSCQASSLAATVWTARAKMGKLRNL